VRENIYDSGQPESPDRPEPARSRPARLPRDWNTPRWRLVSRIATVVAIILGLAPYVISRIFDHVVMTTLAPEDMTVFWIGNRETILARCLTFTCGAVGLIAFWFVARRLRHWIRYAVTIVVITLVVLPKMAFDGVDYGLPEVSLMASVEVAGGQASVRHYCLEYCPFICKQSKLMKPVIVVDDRRPGTSGRTVEYMNWQTEVHNYGLCGRLQASKTPDTEVRLTARPRLCADYTKEEDENDIASGLVRYNPDKAQYVERGLNADWCRPQWPVIKQIWPAPAPRR
jgi:hypothetical protein